MAKQQPEATDDKDEGGGFAGFTETLRRLLRVSKDEVREAEEQERDKRGSA